MEKSKIEPASNFKKVINIQTNPSDKAANQSFTQRDGTQQDYLETKEMNGHRIVASSKHNGTDQTTNYFSRFITPNKKEGNIFKNQNTDYTEMKRDASDKFSKSSSQNIGFLDRFNLSRSPKLILSDKIVVRQPYNLEISSPYRSSQRLISESYNSGPSENKNSAKLIQNLHWKPEGQELYFPQNETTQKAPAHSSASVLHEKVRERNMRELEKLLDIKINQERLRKKILYVSPSRHQMTKQNAPLHSSRESDESATPRGNVLDNLDTEPKNDLLPSARQESYLASPQIKTSQNSVLSKETEERHMLPPLKINKLSPARKLYNLAHNERSPKGTKRKGFQKIKFQLKSDRVSELAKSLVNVGSNRMNYSKLLQDTYDKDKNLFNQPETENFDKILETEAHRARSKRTEKKYDFLMQMDIVRKMLPVNNALDEYKSFKEKLQLEKARPRRIKHVHILNDNEIMIEDDEVHQS